jgi:hypothetical protein
MTLLRTTFHCWSPRSETMVESDFSNRYSIRDNTSQDIDDLQLGCTLNKTIV